MPFGICDSQILKKFTDLSYNRGRKVGLTLIQQD